jgi:Na+-driven multidrug efflux pump
MLILSSHFILKNNNFKFVKLKLEIRCIKDICAIGVSSLISEFSSGIVMIIYNIIILKLQGNVGVAAYGVVANLSLVFISLFTGVSQGVQPIISNNYGRENNRNVKKAFQYAIITSAVMAIGIYILTYYYAELIAVIFNEEQNKILENIVVGGLRLYFTALIFAGFNIVTSVYFSSTDHPFEAFVLSIFRGFVIIIPMAFIMANLLGMTGVWLAFPFTEGITAMIAVAFIRKAHTMKKLQH